MDDEELVNRLRRYRPKAPPAGLRPRITQEPQITQITRTEAAGRAWPWMTAAAALLAITIALTGATARLAVPIDAGPDETARAIDDLTMLLGGDESARQMAMLIVAEEEARRALLSASAAPSPDEELP